MLSIQGVERRRNDNWEVNVRQNGNKKVKVLQNCNKYGFTYYIKKLYT